MWWNWSSVCCFLVVYFLPCKMLVDNKFSRDAERTLFLWIYCSHPCLRKTKFKRVQLAWIPKCLPPNFFFLERDSIILSFFIVHPLFFIEKLNKVEIKLPKHSKEVFWHYTHCDPWKVICAFFACRAIFFWSASRTLFYL